MGNGTVASDASGWYYVLDVPNPEGALGPDGKPKRKQEKRRFATRRDADRALRIRLNELEEGVPAAAGVTVAEFLTSYWLPSVRASVARSTYAYYERQVRLHISPAIGATRLDALRPMMLSEFYASLLDDGADRRSTAAKGLSAKSIRHVHVTLGRAMRAAIAEGLIGENPCTGAVLPKRRKPVTNVLRWEEIEPMLELWNGHFARDPIEFAVYTGLRRGEILALRWRNVDLGGRFIEVETSRGSVGGVVFEDVPKTPRSRRSVPLVGRALEIIEARFAEQAPGDGDGHVFTDNMGRPLDPDGFSKIFSSRVRSRRWRGTKVRFHDLRHTFATLALTRFNTPIHALSAILGHTSTAFTMDTYGHLMRGDLHAAMSGWEDPDRLVPDVPTVGLREPKVGWADQTDADIRAACQDAASIRVICQRLGVSAASKNYDRLRAEADRLGITLPVVAAGRPKAA